MTLEEKGVALSDWFDANMRDLPWRHTRDPYCIWVSEIMLQQTRVETVLDYYDRFLACFPTAEALAAADWDAVAKAWEGLGYYRRAKYLLLGAQRLVKDYGGVFPQTAEEMRKIPGIGEYTAGAIAAQAFGERVAAVDGNVLRVMTRLENLEDSIDLPATRQKVGTLSVRMMPQGRAWSHTQALMELGATVCTPTGPRCGVCPLREACEAQRLGRAEVLPNKSPKAKPVPTERTIILLMEGGRVWLRRRPEDGLLAGLWEFPAREDGLDGLWEELGAGPSHRHVFTHRVWQMQSLFARPLVRPAGGLWADETELTALPLPSAMEPFRQAILEKWRQV